MPCRLLVALHAAREGGTAPALLRSLAPLGAPIVVFDQTADPAVAAASAAAGAELVPLALPLRRPAAWNRVLDLARERGGDLLLVVEDAVRIDAAAVRSLLAAMEDAPRVAVLSPARIPAARDEPATYRARWHLDAIALDRDPDLPHRDCAWLDADFCETDVALLRVAALCEAGGLEDAFGDRFADANLGFRLRVAGWSLGAAPQAQAVASGIAPPDLGTPSLEDDRALFARRHLGYGVALDDPRSCPPLGLTDEPWRDVLRSHGLVRASGLPLSQVRAAAAKAGRSIPFGVDTDVFAPWGPVETRKGGPRFLWISPRGGRGGRGGFGAVLEAWRAFRASGGQGSLLCIGRGLARAAGMPARILGASRLADDPDAGLALIEPLAPFAPPDLAALLRGVDFVISRDAGQSRAVLHAMACGAVPIAGGSEALLRAAGLSAAEREAASAAAIRTVRGGRTLRHAAFALRAALADAQEREEIATVPPPPTPVRQARPDVPAMVDYARGLAARAAPRASLLRGLPFFRRRPDPADFAEFDAEAYLRENPDVAAAGVSPLNHFAREGWLEGRRLSARLDTRRYLLANARARQALLDIHAGRRAPPREAAAPIRPEARKPGVLVVGYVEAGLGLGESSRGLARALAGSDLPFALHPYNQSVEGRFSGPFMPERTDRGGAYDVTLFEAAGDQLPDFLDQFAARMAGSHAIFRTYWELAEAPRAWARNLGRFDEIWAPTRFVAEAFRRVFEGPITVVPPCVSVAEEAGLGRAAFGLPREDFLFLFTFDVDSVPARKNPMGLVSAFQAAFPPGESGVGLVLKATGAPHRAPATRAALALAARRDPRIVLLDGAIPRGEVLSLIRACDGYVSLHRSEGFGYGMAEALALGRPVIGTDYSGNTDFLDETTGYPVPWHLRALRDGEYPHATEEGQAQSWAEPDLAAASALMRRVRTDEADRVRRTEAGRLRIAERFSAEAVGRIATERLRAILRDRGV